MTNREPVILGVADAPLEKGRLQWGGTVLSAQARVARAALAEAGATLDDVNGLFTAGVWGLPGPGAMPTLALSEYLGIAPRYSDSSNIGGAAFESHVAHAARAIAAGDCDVALIVYGSTQRSDVSRSLGGADPILMSQYETPYGLPRPAGSYALAAARHMYQYGTTSEELAEVAVAARAWAALNPAASYHTPLTIDDVLCSGLICDPLHKLDCCLVTDGAGAVVMTTAEHARSAGRVPVHVRGWGEAQTHLSIASMPDLTIVPASSSGRDAFQMAGIGPGDVDVAELYDSFTITVLLTLEALGFCGAGEGGKFVANGRIAPGGEFPLNTSGGGLSYAHPGMFGIFLLIEAVRQLRGEAGQRQVPDAHVALVNGSGGVLSSASTCILATS